VIALAQSFPSRDALLGVGMCLVMLGLVLRGFASSIRRDLARRSQHRRDDRKSGDASLNAQFEQPPDWWEQNLGKVANVVLGIGVLTALAAYAIR
jgi:hypothetical protein